MSNPLADSLAIPELKRRFLVTLLLLLVYRIGCHVTVPGVDLKAVQAMLDHMARNNSGGGGMNGVLQMFNLFTGGALLQVSVFALGVMPYISTSIILQLLTEVVPQLKQLKNEGQAGQRKINQYTRYGTVVLALFQAVMMTNVMRASLAQQLQLPDSVAWTAVAALTLTTGTMFLMWLGEQITEFGIGNGMSLIIFIGIVSRLPTELRGLWQVYEGGASGLTLFGLLFFALTMAVLLVLSVVTQLSYRKVPVQYAQRQMGRQLMGGGTTVLPLKVDYSGVIAVIFSSSLMVFPMQIVSYLKTNAWVAKNDAWAHAFDVAERWLGHGHPVHVVLYTALTIFFCFFYTAMVFNTDDVAENMKKYGGFIPGLRPGKATADFLARILDRITLGGAVMIVVIAVVPDLMARYMGVPWFFGGTTFLIVVGVALDTMRQVEAHLLMRHYDGFAKDQKIRGRFG